MCKILNYQFCLPALIFYYILFSSVATRITMILLTSDNKGPILTIIASILLIFETIAVLSRVGVKYWVIRRVAMDDWMIIAALVSVHLWKLSQWT